MLYIGFFYRFEGLIKIKLMENSFEKDSDDVFTQVVRAGKRTYFFDVKETRSEEYYITITESKKHIHPDGSYDFQKHKIYLYKEDFAKFKFALEETLKKIEELNSIQ